MPTTSRAFLAKYK